jgi:hypothetical protein
MKSKLPVKVHPVANIFPMMSAEEFDGLKSDIEKHDVRESIVFWNDELIDGRNRLAAMIELGIDWKSYTCELEADIDPVAYVISHNLHRRHLDTSQRAMVAARLREAFDVQAAERQKATVGRPKKDADKSPVNLPANKGDARDKAGEALGVSGKTVDHATAVLESGDDDLIAKVDAGEVSVSKAAKIARGETESEPEEKETGVYVSLRKTFDSMQPHERLIAVEMMKGWSQPPSNVATIWRELQAKLDTFEAQFEKSAQDCDEARDVMADLDKLQERYGYYVRNVEGG